MILHGRDSNSSEVQNVLFVGRKPEGTRYRDFAECRGRLATQQRKRIGLIFFETATPVAFRHFRSLDTMLFC